MVEKQGPYHTVPPELYLLFYNTLAFCKNFSLQLVNQIGSYHNCTPTQKVYSSFLKHKKFKLLILDYLSSANAKCLIHSQFYNSMFYLKPMVKFRESNTGGKIFVDEENYHYHYKKNAD